MPVNLDALIRYHTIDQCLQNRFRKWTWEALSDACFNALDEVKYRSEKSRVSKRTIQNDIRVMRSDILGYNAPITCIQGVYSYTDRTYSVKNASLTRNDLETIAITAKLLGQYRGFDLQGDLEGMVERLETKVLVQQFEQSKRLIEFEQFPPNKGQKFLKPLLELIRTKTALEITYKRFDQQRTQKHVVHPYLLKEYRNRWYLLGLNEKHRRITTYALDRMIFYTHMENVEFIENGHFDAAIYFKHTIGITYNKDLLKILIDVKSDFVPYLLTQPLHNSQKLIERREESATFQLVVVNNPELQTLLLGYADIVTVQQPQSLRNELSLRLREASDQYQTLKNLNNRK